MKLKAEIFDGRVTVHRHKCETPIKVLIRSAKRNNVQLSVGVQPPMRGEISADNLFIEEAGTHNLK